MAQPLDADAFLLALSEHISAVLARFVQPANLYEPIRYILELPAKRTRPQLVYLGYRWFNPAASFRPLLGLAAAVEMFHTFTLVHDDIMDHAPARRGQPTIHTLWNINTGILSGDALLILAYQQLNDLSGHPRFGMLLDYFHQTALRVCEGQVIDLQQAEAQSVVLEEYIEMIRLKTAVLLGASLAMGALAAGASLQQIDQLQTFGEHAGIAFQLQDDYLDLYADVSQFGKQLGGDIIEKKKSILWILAYERSDESTRAEMSHRMQTDGDEAAKIDWFRNLYHQLDIEEAANELIKHRFDQARTQLSQFSNPEQQEALLIFLNQLEQRNR